ncbi:hypothetical protein, partial [Yersinia similis]|uniref:hypothetical protein n=1 Tax=Yersinia similis TaxID=367190 RepID=UPI001C96F4ED
GQRGEGRWCAKRQRRQSDRRGGAGESVSDNYADTEGCRNLLNAPNNNFRQQKTSCKLFI